MKNNESGFTILELIIATTIFSVMMLLASAGIIQIGRVYYKGIIQNRTQETVRSVVDDISKNYQVSGATGYGSSPAPGPNGEQAICIGLTRYNYRTGINITNADPHVLWTDKMLASGNCKALNLKLADPSAGDATSDATGGGLSARRELLAKNMRLADFTVPPPTGNGTLSISTRVIFGDYDLVEPGNLSCISTRFGGQFCAVASLNSFVKRRL